MPLRLGQLAHLVGKGERLNKILELEDVRQALDALPLYDFPFRHLARIRLVLLR